ncbi:MAG TPA: glycosyltransferase family 2 protein [Ferruginibacter sp.]|nr:glycosyltransferase family 2 protein [Ferruginibacter sp.]
MTEAKNIDLDEQASSEPLVTIGLPTYNRPLGLQKCLETIVSQSYKNLEIIISDNCSTDECVQQVIQAFAAKDARIKHFRQPVNIGLEGNFNFVYTKASAALFTWMSDDDHFDTNYVFECVKFLQANPCHVLCSGVAKYYSGNDFLFEEQMFKVDQPGALKRVFTYFSKAGKNGNFYGVFRSNILKANPLGEHVGCDWSFMAKLAILGKLSFVTTTQYYRSADGNSGTRNKMVKKFRLNRFKNIFFETYSAYEISTHIFNDAAVNGRFNYLQRQFIIALVFSQINFKLFMNFVQKKLKQS